ncbi:MAG: NAD(P)-dependent oxidoreductase [Firmicutes bacterium]|nr:NAD(P)-dependent oxidoreductase [Bacillota bacterium]
MYAIDEKLHQLQVADTPIQVGLVGAGQMGTDILAQVEGMVGIEVPVVVDVSWERAQAACAVAQCERDVICTDDPEEAIRAIRAGKLVATTNYKLATSLPMIQVVIDATGSPEMGAKISLTAINHKKHVVMMNVECDVTIGPILCQMARSAGVIYTLTAGDEPGSIMEVYRFARALGFEIVAAGKGKNNPLDIYATPDSWAERAKIRNMNPHMLVEFVDGSKTMVEMAAVSNATGLIPDIRGMHGPSCNVKDLTGVFCLEEQGGILNRTGVVDYAIGDINPGVFVIVTTKHPRLISSLVQRDMGNGPNYLLFRPYHLCSIETPLTAAQAVIYGEATMQPFSYLTSECITVAKRNLKAGETLDGIGGYCYRGSIELAGVARQSNMLPLGLAKGAVLLEDIPKDGIITYDAVELNENSILLQLRRLQDQLLEHPSI